jgi:hypothetical protein
MARQDGGGTGGGGCAATGNTSGAAPCSRPRRRTPPTNTVASASTTNTTSKVVSAHAPGNGRNNTATNAGENNRGNWRSKNRSAGSSGAAKRANHAGRNCCSKTVTADNISRPGTGPGGAPNSRTASCSAPNCHSHNAATPRAMTSGCGSDLVGSGEATVKGPVQGRQHLRWQQSKPSGKLGQDRRPAMTPERNPKLEPGWLAVLGDVFEQPFMHDLRRFLVEEKSQYTVYPPGKDIFAAFDHTPFAKVRVVILGQDPYHGPNQAHGLCFSVRPGVPPPPSLQNIFAEIEQDLGIARPRHGYLTHWADQGVLLLNTVLTVRGRASGFAPRPWLGAIHRPGHCRTQPPAGRLGVSVVGIAGPAQSSRCGQAAPPGPDGAASQSAVCVSRLCRLQALFTNQPLAAGTRAPGH